MQLKATGRCALRLSTTIIIIKALLLVLSIVQAKDIYKTSEDKMGNLDGKTCLERLASIIPGYDGYLEKERRRDIDKLHREHLAEELEKLKNPLNRLTQELTETGRLMEIKPIEKASGKLDKIANRIRYASYGYSGFFDVVKVKEFELDRLYQFDLSLTEDIDTIKTQVSSLSESNDAANLKTAINTLISALDDFDSHFTERHKAIENTL